ncbi:MAG: D-lactate dehydrogenase family protein [Myxococcales bacterium]
MDTTQAQTFLAEQDLLRHVEPGTLRALAAELQERRLQPGEALFREGDPGHFVFFVVSGRLQARKRSAEGDEVVLRHLGRGDVGGLTSMALQRERSATLQADDAVVVYTIDSSVFRRLLGERGDLARSLIAFLGDKVRGKTGQLAGLLSRVSRDPRPGVLVYDAKGYDRKHLGAAADDLAFEFQEARLGPETAALAAGHEAVCAFVNDDLSAPVLERLKGAGVGLIALRCAGFNNVDLEAAANLGLSVARVPAYSPHAVAEHAVALILGLNRKTHRAYNRVREGNFSLSGLEGFDLYGRTAGVIGTGKIGRCLAEILRGFGMRVLAHDPRPDEGFAERTGVEYVELPALLPEAHLISLHAPLTPQTQHLIDAEALAMTRPGVMLINTSRGALVDTAALIEGLKRGHVGSAGLDVYEEESEYFFEDLSGHVLTDDVLARLLTFPNVLVTSHQAFLTTDALRNIAEVTVHNIRQFLAGERGAELDNAVVQGR